ncbi:SCO2400 family protein [Streptomyces coelicoflavus]|uniref:Uncharacterized protein n=1 Tax=Streptomyces coelicoflavus TaxID=285562 RepID=A0A6N9UHK9_9ACTN|nr:hypothetical protein [Streptomyces coelicoflavus]NEB17251.1 hypothetical protein [Streptomyces coelicoflavus]
MDYCSSCRRHLNGALVCPGCGAYAPDIAPHVTVGDRDADTVPALPAPGPAPVPTDTPAADVVELPPARQQGRAARRRQLTRWKKNKRRAVVASAVALVGGGLSLATMDRQSGDRAQATTAPDHRSMGVADEEITERDRPVPAPTTPEDTHRSSRTPAQPYEQRHEQSQSSAVGAPRHQSVAEASRTAPATPPRTTASSPSPAAPTVPQPPSTDTSTADSSTADSSTAGSGSADSGSGRSDSTAGRTPAPSTADGGASDTSPTSPALISTSPTEVCLLGLCLG